MKFIAYILLCSGVFPSTSISTGFCSAHTAASRYPSSNSLSRIESSAGSSAHLNSCTKELVYVIIKNEVIYKWKHFKISGNIYLSRRSPIFRVAVWANPNSLQSQTTGRKSTHTDLLSNNLSIYLIDRNFFLMVNNKNTSTSLYDSNPQTSKYSTNRKWLSAKII